MSIIFVLIFNILRCYGKVSCWEDKNGYKCNDKFFKIKVFILIYLK